MARQEILDQIKQGFGSVFPAIRAGARGYLLKDADQTELLRAIQTVASGGTRASLMVTRPDA